MCFHEIEGCTVFYVCLTWSYMSWAFPKTKTISSLLVTLINFENTLWVTHMPRFGSMNFACGNVRQTNDDGSCERAAYFPLATSRLRWTSPSKVVALCQDLLERVGGDTVHVVIDLGGSIIYRTNSLWLTNTGTEHLRNNGAGRPAISAIYIIW